VECALNPYIYIHAHKGGIVEIHAGTPGLQVRFPINGFNDSGAMVNNRRCTWAYRISSFSLAGLAVRITPNSFPNREMNEVQIVSTR
jgi:hypothetical protein